MTGAALPDYLRAPVPVVARIAKLGSLKQGSLEKTLVTHPGDRAPAYANRGGFRNLKSEE